MVKAPVYSKSEKLPEGTILPDQRKEQWCLGPSIGQGGFGCIYSAKSSSSKVYDKVIKIEPSTNGPLFTEINFCKRVGKEDDIKKFMKNKKLNFLGMPRYISFGITGDNRFLVMDRFGEDLHKTLMRCSLSFVCILQISLNMMDVLEYIHSMEYAHADIKALNIMRGYTNPSEIYLLDFGMVSKYSDNGKHRAEKIDPKCKNNGTVEFSPRDSHSGLQPSRRGDMESLLYNMIFWLTWDEKNPNTSRLIGFGKLPWLSILRGISSEKVPLQTINAVAESKFKYMKNPNTFITSVGLNVHSWSHHLVKMLADVDSLRYDEKPDYDGMRTIIATIISEIDGKPINVHDNRIVTWPSDEPSKARTSRKRPSHDATNDSKDVITKKKRITPANEQNNNQSTSEPSTAKIRDNIDINKSKNVFKNFEDSDSDIEFQNNIKSKQIIPRRKLVSDSPISEIIKKKSDTNVGESSSKENYDGDESINEISSNKESKANKSVLKEKSTSGTKKTKVTTRKPPKVKAVKESPLAEELKKVPKIPGMKMLQALKLGNGQKNASKVAEASKTNVIIPGMKDLDRLKEASRKSPRTKKPTNKSSPPNSVRCQTSPGLLR